MTKAKDLVIIYRTCDKVDAVSGHPRIQPKKEVIKRCSNSLVRAVDYYIHHNTKDPKDVYLYTIDDHSSDETKTHLKDNVNKGYDFIELDTTGNSESLKTCYTLADSMDEDCLIFFLEDDYLLEHTALDEMVFLHDVLSNTKQIITHPVDYIDRYKKLYDSKILLGKSVHWRTIHHTTGTFMIPKSIFTECRINYTKFTDYGVVPGVTEDNSINLTYSKYPCFSPMPSLGHHYQYLHTLSPYSNHQKLWEINANPSR